MSDSEIGLKFKVFLGDLESGFSKAESKVKGFVNSTKKSFDSIGKSTKHLFEGKWSMFGGAIAGAAVYETIKKVGEFDDSIRRLAIDSNMSTKEMLQFKQQVLDTGIKTGTSTDSLTEMSQEAYKTSKNIKFVTDELGFMAKVGQASGASASEIGEGLGELQRETGLTGKAFETMVSNLGAFGATKETRMNLKQFLPQAGPLLDAAKVLMKTGAIKDANKVLMEGMFTGSPQAVARAYMNMNSRKNRDLIKRLGLQQGFTLAEAIQSVFASKAKNKQGILQMLLGQRTLTSLEPLINDVDKLAEAEKHASSIDFMARADVQSKSFGASMNRLQSTFMSLADTGLAPVIDEINKALGDIDPKQVAEFAKTLGQIAQFSIKAAEGVMTFVNAITSLGTASNNAISIAANTTTATNENKGTLLEKANAWRTTNPQAAMRLYQSISNADFASGNTAEAVRLQKVSVEVKNYIDGKEFKSTHTTTTKRGEQGTPK